MPNPRLPYVKVPLYTHDKARKTPAPLIYAKQTHRVITNHASATSNLHKPRPAKPLHRTIATMLHMNTPRNTNIHETDDRQDILLMAQRYASAGYQDIAGALLSAADDLKPTYDRRNSADLTGTHPAEVSIDDASSLPTHPQSFHEPPTTHIPPGHRDMYATIIRFRGKPEKDTFLWVNHKGNASLYAHLTEGTHHFVPPHVYNQILDIFQRLFHDNPQKPLFSINQVALMLNDEGIADPLQEHTWIVTQYLISQEHVEPSHDRLAPFRIASPNLITMRCPRP